ncbi:MAG: sodium:proton antiporter [Acidocella sp.]|nr:sodium:proton antiporter [Acidocella sp.]
MIAALPFIGILLSFALLPGLAPRFWHRHRAPVILTWVLLGVGLTTITGGLGTALLGLWRASLVEFMPFMALLLALYALGGGIAVKGGPWGRPEGNLLLLAIGTILASIMGTIGASLLLIHPLLAANGHRQEKRHLVLAFIILVGNCGGALSPLGDPPLLVGYLRGVPIMWPLMHLWAPLAVLAIPILALTYALDRHFAKAEVAPKPARLRVRGIINIVLLVGLCAAIPLSGLWRSQPVIILHAAIPGAQLALLALEIAIIAISEALTPRAIRTQNRFAWGAMREITILFFAIFATITPVFALLQSAALPQIPALWFWASGIASAVLDAAPTYLIFFQAAGGHAATLITPPAHLLTALAAGSVFFGPVTYLGNAPNLMVREIASRRGVKMPGFLTYAAIMVVILTPIYVVLTMMFYW